MRLIWQNNYLFTGKRPTGNNYSAVEMFKKCIKLDPVSRLEFVF
jgi:hypothetical protein